MGGTGEGTLRVLIVEDHQMVAEGFALGLRTAGDVTVVAVSTTVAEARVELQRGGIDVVLLDYRLPDGDGITLAGEIRDAAGPSVVMVTSHSDATLARSALDAGCRGFVLKHSSLDEVLRAVRAVGRGEMVVSSAVLGSMLAPPPSDGTAGSLTRRESEVLQLLADGVGTAEIARRLFLSVNTVRNHVQNVLLKLGAHSKLEAVAIASRRQLVRRS